MNREWIIVTGLPGAIKDRFSVEAKAIEAAERLVTRDGGTVYVFELVETVSAVASRSRRPK